MQVWPRKRGAPKSPVTVEQNTLFQRLADLHKNAMDIEKVAARDIAWGSGYTWRDVLSRAAVGRLIVWGPYVSEDIQSQLDTICNNPGAMLLRSDDEWHCLLPGTDGYVLTVDPVTHRPLFLPLPSAGGSGLFSGSLSGLPTQANTGFTTWAQQPAGSTVLNTVAGVEVFQPAQSSAHIPALLTKAVSTPPYTVTALLAHAGPHVNFSAMEFGWSNGLSGSSFKAQTIHHSYADGLNILDYTGLNPASVAVPGSTLGTMTNVPDLYWFQLRDDGTTVSFKMGADGVRFSTIYSIAKASGFLGATGYNHLVFGCDAFNRESAGTIMSYHEGA